MPEGDMTKLRASIVCEPTLALCARDIWIWEIICSLAKERSIQAADTEILSYQMQWKP